MPLLLHINAIHKLAVFAHQSILRFYLGHGVTTGVQNDDWGIDWNEWVLLQFFWR